jgi:hypothetical protein
MGEGVMQKACLPEKDDKTNEEGLMAEWLKLGQEKDGLETE